MVKKWIVYAVEIPLILFIRLNLGDWLVAQWFELHAFIAQGMGSTPCQKTWDHGSCRTTKRTTSNNNNWTSAWETSIIRMFCNIYYREFKEGALQHRHQLVTQKQTGQGQKTRTERCLGHLVFRKSIRELGGGGINHQSMAAIIHFCSI